MISPATVEIRPARPDDAIRLAELRWEFRSGRAAPAEERGAFLARCAAWMAEELDSGRWRAWVAVADAQIVGQVWLHTIQKVPNPVGERDRHAYVSNLYVTPSARGSVGTELLRAALAHAASHGVDRVILWPSARSRSLYERHGFRSNGDVLELTCQ
jgi:GNAT superfamily N-acetyltransferase